MRFISQILLLLALCHSVYAQKLDLPPRPAGAPQGAEFALSISKLDRAAREEKIYQEVARGNVPEFLRTMVPIHVESVAQGGTNTATYYVIPDYLAVGSDEDYFIWPLSPITAQKLATLLHCSLPTRKMVNDIYSVAALKGIPSPIPPSSAMATVPVFIQHNETLMKQRKEQLPKYPLGSLVAGHKKDVVISNKLKSPPGRVAIYGWHKPDGKPIQPLYTGHADTYADYSHGIRLVQSKLQVNGATKDITEVMSDADLSPLLSNEGVILEPRYPEIAYEGITQKQLASKDEVKKITLKDFQKSSFGEQVVSYTIGSDINVHINAPIDLDRSKKLKLIFYTLPNGNTIEQTVGRELRNGDDWHFDIQHIGAQTRFLREKLKDCNIVVAYLEAANKSWPAWRKKHDDQARLILETVKSIRGIFEGAPSQITLSGHSGGGSFIFGYLNAVEEIPSDVERITFLDSNYAYDPAAKHKEKLVKWLETSDGHFLSVLAYNDAVALLNGTNFVSKAGGTWGRSHLMIEDLAKDFKFTSVTNGGFETYTALNRRVQFLLKENPDKKIYHTVQVERNGFIQSMLSGTSLEGEGYVYFGDRAYTNWIGK